MARRVAHPQTVQPPIKMTSCGYNKGCAVQIVQIRDAKAGFSALMAAAEGGQPTTISRHGKPCAMVVPYEDGQRLYAATKPNLASYLLGMPEVLDTDRDSTPMRVFEL
jgi:prevent-host-death family protein